ncbi:zinc-ribbon domain-containing protein, partial [Escherichia coli]|nr:zinc-ribbon domain-containing protein [Escherichia coli]
MDSDAILHHGHFVTSKVAVKYYRQDMLGCVSCGCPLTLK